MAISSYKTFLMIKNGGTWSKLVDVKDYPDLGGERPQLDATTLSDGKHKYIADIEDVDTFTFTCNYDAAEFATLKALKGQQIEYAIWFGATVDESTGIATPTGSEGVFNFTGDLDVYKNGHGVSEVQDMTINIIVSDGPHFSESAPAGAVTLSLNKSILDLGVSEQFQLVPTAVPANATITYTSADTSTATVTSGGKVTGAAAGTTVIVVEAVSDGVEAVATCTVNVVSEG